MLRLAVPGKELYDELKEEFINTKSQVLQLEHSLVSLARWESIWNKPFLTEDSKTTDEMLSYVKCMTITQNVSNETYLALTEEHLKEIDAYISRTMTATTINRDGRKPGREIITAEIIYYSMVVHSIPFECQKWHLDRLMTLIDVCNVKSQPPKKMSRREILERNKRLNEQRKSKLNTKG